MAKAKRDSPCVAICTTLYDDVCRGCGRTAQEVANWSTFTQSEKDIVWARLNTKEIKRESNNAVQTKANAKLQGV